MARPDWARRGSRTANDAAASVSGTAPARRTRRMEAAVGPLIRRVRAGYRYRAIAGRLLREVSTWSMSPYSRDSSAERILSRSMSVLTCSFVRFE